MKKGVSGRYKFNILKYYTIKFTMDNNICEPCEPFEPYYTKTFVEYVTSKNTCKGECNGGPFCKDQFDPKYPLEKEMNDAIDMYNQLKTQGIDERKKCIYILKEEDRTLIQEYNKYIGEKMINKIEFLNKIWWWTDYLKN